MKWAIFALLLIISCAPATQEVITKPVMDQQIEAPKTEPVPVLEPQIKAPQQVAAIQATPTPSPKIEETPSLSPEEECIQDCEENCKATAQNSCTQSGRADCKDICNDNPVIDPSACTQSCTYLNQPNVCKQQMEQFCSAQCVGFCH